MPDATGWNGDGPEDGDDCDPLVMVRFDLRGGPLDGESDFMPDENESILVVQVAPGQPYRVYGDDPKKIPRSWCVGHYAAGYVPIGAGDTIVPMHWKPDELPEGLTDDDFRQPRPPRSAE